MQKAEQICSASLFETLIVPAAIAGIAVHYAHAVAQSILTAVIIEIVAYAATAARTSSETAGTAVIVARTGLVTTASTARAGLIPTATTARAGLITTATAARAGLITTATAARASLVAAASATRTGLVTAAFVR